MHSDVHLEFEGIHQLFCCVNNRALIFSIFILKLFSLLPKKYLFQQLALITFDFSNEQHLMTLLIKNQIMKSKNLKK